MTAGTIIFGLIGTSLLGTVGLLILGTTGIPRTSLTPRPSADADTGCQPPHSNPHPATCVRTLLTPQTLGIIHLPNRTCLSDKVKRFPRSTAIAVRFGFLAFALVLVWTATP